MDRDEKTKKQDRTALYLLRCPNPSCGKIHFSVLNSLIQGLRVPTHCLGCQKAEKISHYLVYERDAKILLRSYCELCAKESVKILNGIHRVCERCGWEGEFFLGFQEIAA